MTGSVVYLALYQKGTRQSTSQGKKLEACGIDHSLYLVLRFRIHYLQPPSLLHTSIWHSVWTHIYGTLEQFLLMCEVVSTAEIMSSWMRYRRNYPVRIIVFCYKILRWQRLGRTQGKRSKWVPSELESQNRHSAAKQMLYENDMLRKKLKN
jgi:hypothetical protein